MQSNRGWMMWLSTLAACGSSPTHSTPVAKHECSAHGAAEHEHYGHDHGAMPRFDGDPEAWAKRFDDPTRDVWQRPDDVIRALDLRPAMTVADIGAGTGYFAVRLARAVPNGQVIATDIEPEMLRYLDERARREQLPNLRTAHATQATSGLAPASVDAILIVDVWHHVTERVCYARDLATALRPGGKVVIVDFKLDATRGPPSEMRLTPESIVADLAAAGLDAKRLPIELPEQYIVEARRP